MVGSEEVLVHLITEVLEVVDLAEEILVLEASEVEVLAEEAQAGLGKMKL